VTHKRVALVLLGGSLLLLTPFLVSLSQGVEKSIFSAMATLTDVKETLDEKLILMSDLYLSLDAAPADKQLEKAQEAAKHFKYASEVHQLATSFIGASSKRYPRYGTFWERYNTRLTATWAEITAVNDKITAQVASLPRDGNAGTTAVAAAAVAPGGAGASAAVAAAPKQAPVTATTNTVATVGAITARTDERTAERTAPPTDRAGAGNAATDRAAAFAAAEQRAAAARAAAQLRAASEQRTAAPTQQAAAQAQRTAAPAQQAAVSTQQAAAPSGKTPELKVTKKTLDRKDVLERYREGYQHFAQGGDDNLEKAAVAFREILDAQPAFHLARYWLAKTYLLQNKVVDARRESDSLLQAQPNLQIAKDLSRDVTTVEELRSKSGAVGATARAAAAKAPLALPPAVAATKPTARSQAAVPTAVAAASTAPAPKPTVAPSGCSLIDQATAAMLARVERRVDGKMGPGTRGTSRPAAAPAARSAAVPAASSAARPAARPAARSQSVVPSNLLAAGAQGSTVAARGAAHRPIACMIENSKAARPQAGLSKADIVYEMPVEGGITRFMAVFLNPETVEVDKLGPVRSARHYFVQQVPALDALYAHCGASSLGYAEIKKAGVDDIDEIKFGYGFFRDEQRQSPHNLFTKLGSLREAFKRRGFSTASRKHPEFMPTLTRRQRSFDPSYVDLDLAYHGKYRVSYTYDPLQDAYFRSLNGAPHVDALDNTQLTADNVIVARVTTKVLDTYGRLDMDLSSGGEAELHRGGKVVRGSWQRSGRYGEMRFFDEQGQQMALNSGRTWIQFVNQRASVTVATRPMPAAAAQQLARIAAASRDQYALAAPVTLAPPAPVDAAAPALAPVRVVAAAPVAASAASARPSASVPRPAARPAAKPSARANALPTASVVDLAAPHALAPAGPTAPAAHRPAARQQAAAPQDQGVIDVIDFELEAF